MIPDAYIKEWYAYAPWHKWTMVEQDLLISRMLIELFRDEHIRGSLIFRGGTALHKLFFPEPLRFSEDIDLVQRETGPIGPLFDTIRGIFRKWLGKPVRKQGPGVATLTYRLSSEDIPPLPLRIKIEINTREHFQVLPIKNKSMEVHCRWFEGRADIPVYQIEELMATKLRALYQRRKGRDLFDLAAALRNGLIPLIVSANAPGKTLATYQELEITQDVPERLPGSQCHVVIWRDRETHG